MLLPLLLAASWLLPVQQTGSIHGLVLHVDSAAPVPDARVVAILAGADPVGGQREWTATTTATGAFAFDALPPGRYSVAISTVGFIFVRRTVDVVAGQRTELVVPLAEGTGAYRETVTVSAENGTPPALEAMSASVLGSAGLQDLRGVVTDDPLRAVQALPGVATGDDLRSDFSVRGSAFRHTGVVIDGTPTTLLLHTVRGEDNTGSIAMINTDVLSRAALLAGPHARRHGDWLGATLEFDMREGSRDRSGIRGAVSGTSASVVGEGPVGSRQRGSWIVSLRRSYLDWLIRKVEPGFDSTLGFWDGYAKVAFDVSPRHHLQVMGVTGDATYREREASRANGLDRARSRSTLGSIAWRYSGARAVLTSRASFSGNDFRNSGVLAQELGRGYAQSILLRADLSIRAGREWTVELGGLRERQRMNEIARVFRTTTNGQIAVQTRRDVSPRTTLTSGYVQLSRQDERGGVTLGLRASDRTISSRPGISPWLLAERRTGKFAWRGSLGASAQFPDPLFVFEGTEPINPERAWGGDLGVAYQIDARTELRVSSFHRSEADGLRRASEDRLDPATGVRRVASTFALYAAPLDVTSRGAEVVLMRRSTIGLSGWIGYMWSHTRARDRQTAEAFDGDFDQRHTLNMVVTQRLSYRTSVGAKLRVGSNVPLTGYFAGTLDDLRLATTRNTVRLPTYARLDLRATRTFTFDTRRLTLFVEVMNALGRDNYGQSDGTIRNTLRADGYLERMIPFVPSAGFLVEF
jgi:hypothetical protein